MSKKRAPGRSLEEWMELVVDLHSLLTHFYTEY